MKRILIILLVILVGSFVVLSYLDTSEYRAERRFWRLQKDFMKIARDPSVVPELAFADLIDQYGRIIRENPGARLNGQIIIQQGKVYLLKKDYARARAAFETIPERFPGDESLNAEALFHTGLSYEEEGKGEQALSVYGNIKEKYPLTATGLNMPLYIANYYVRTGQPDAAQEAFDQAAAFYQDVHAHHPHARAGHAALKFLATVYLAREEWEEGVKVLGMLLLEYPVAGHWNGPNGLLLVKTINQVALKQLKDFDIPVRIYQEYIDRYPGYPLSRKLRQVIQEINSVKEPREDIARP